LERGFTSAAMVGDGDAQSSASVGLAARILIRKGAAHGPTAGSAPGCVQGNIVILPQQYADDFKRYCDLNPQPCPLLAMSAPGDPSLPSLGVDIDIRTDVPKYRVFRDGIMDTEVENITDLWRQDLVTFVLGCSFSFEQALMQSNVGLRYVENHRNVPMYVTNCETKPSGLFSGKMVVSMRDLRMDQGEVKKAVEITSRFPRVHGSPVHIGDASSLGIADLEAPNFGDAPKMAEESDRVPVFWACGVTPQVAIENAKVPFVITHSPGHMLITDLDNSDMQTSPLDLTGSAPGAHGVVPMDPSAQQGIMNVLLDGDIRGMRALVEKGHVPNTCCGDAADLILSRSSGICLIVTGFYIQAAESPETDGPPGAVALGRALGRLGFTPVYVTDRFSHDVVAACAGTEARVIVFPVTSPELSREFAQGLLDGLKPSLLIAIERAGRGADGQYRNMKGVNFSDYNAQIDELFELAHGEIPSIGIADGGNEIGCGDLTASGAIPGADPENLKSPPCVTRTTQLVVAGASNWGGFGIAAALAMRSGCRDLLVSTADGWELVQKAVDAGAVDGILHTPGLASVDGRGEDANSSCLERLHDLVDRYLTSLSCKGAVAAAA